MDQNRKEVADEMAIESFRHVVAMLNYLDKVEEEQREAVDGKGSLIKCAGRLRDFVDKDRMGDIPELPIEYEDVYNLEE